MKTKIALLALYVAFLGLALRQWQFASLLAEVEQSPASLYPGLKREAKSIAVIEHSQRLLTLMIERAETKEEFELLIARRDTTFVLLAVCGTLPLAAYVAFGLRRGQKA